MTIRRVLLVVVMLALPALAASRAHFGGTFRLAVAAPLPANDDPLLWDSPIDAAVLSLTQRSICRLDRPGHLAPVLADATVTPRTVTLTVRPGAASADTALTPALVAQSLERARTEATPYRGLLAPVKSITETADGVELALNFPFPELDAALCHSSLAIAAPTKTRRGGVGPFLPTLLANPLFPEGRPYLDGWVVSPLDARAAERQLSTRKAQLALGVGTTVGPMLEATYLLFNRARTGPTLGPAVEASVDRTDLTRFFVRAPAAPMPNLLPVAVTGPLPDPARPSAPPALGKKLTLLYDASRPDQQAVAARLQVKLTQIGFPLATTGLPRTELRQRWAAGDYDLMLSTVFLPPHAPNALAVVLELARAPHDKSNERLSAIGAGADEKSRSKAAIDLSQALKAELDAVPLYVQGLSLSAGPGVQNLTLGTDGLPALDAVFAGAD